MAWTLTLLLVITVVCITSYFNKWLRSIKKSAFVYPSEAIIEQTLPPEIIEEILMKCDIQTLFSCAQVSKYWNHHAEKPQIQETVINNHAPRVTPAELLAAHPTLDVDSIKWLDYPNYPIQLKAADQLLAKKLGKKLLDMDISSIRYLNNHLYGLNAQNINGNQDEYIGKIRMTMSHRYSNVWYFKVKKDEYVSITQSCIDPKWLWSPGHQVEVIADLNTIKLSHFDKYSKIHQFRVIDLRPNVAGFPIAGQLIGILILLFTPCLLVDLWSAPRTTRNVIEFWFSVVSAIGCNAVTMLIMANHSHSVVRKVGIVLILSALAILSLEVWFYRWTLEFAFYNGMVAGCTVFALMTLALFTLHNHSKAPLVLLTLFCMLVLMLDWQLIVAAINTRTLWWTLVFNLQQQLQLGALMAFINAYMLCFTSSSVSWRLLFAWTRSGIEMFCYSLLAMLFITLAAPETAHKLDLQI